MKKRAAALAAALTMASGTVAAQPDLDAMQRRLEQLETLVGTLRTELDAERAARQRVEANTWVRPVTDGKSLRMQSPTGVLDFQAGGRHEPRTALRLRSKPETNVTGVVLVNTGALAGVDDFPATGLEAAGVWGPFAAQAEYACRRGA